MLRINNMNKQDIDRGLGFTIYAGVKPKPPQVYRCKEFFDSLNKRCNISICSEYLQCNRRK